MRRKVSPEVGRVAVREVLAAFAEGREPADVRSTKATAVRYLLEELGTRHPGRTLEVRVPPYGAVQCVEGPRHTRGTPPNVIETDADTWIRLATGLDSWKESLTEHRVRASGTRASLEGMLPVVPTGLKP